MFNLQSGRHHQSFPALSVKPGLKDHRRNPLAVDNAQTKHTKAVTGLMVDNLNQTVISCGLDGKVKVNIARYASLPRLMNPIPNILSVLLVLGFRIGTSGFRTELAPNDRRYWPSIQ